MQLPQRLKLPQATTQYEKDLEEALTRYSLDLERLLNHGLKFADNFNGQLKSFTSDAVANTEFAVAHTLGRTPTGRVILYQDKAGDLYQGPSTGTAWTSTNLYFKCNVASVTFYVLIF